MSTISRRAVAKGAAWSVPAVAVGVAAPAMAASNTVTSASVCQIFEGSGNANAQTTSVYFALGTNDGTTIKAGTKFVYTVTLDSSTYGSASGAPKSSYGSWMTGVVSNVATSGTTTTFTYTITVTSDNSVSGNCEAYLYWDNTSNSSNFMAPNTTVTITPGSSTPATGNGSAQAGGVSFNTGVRWETSVNDPSHLKPVNFLSKTGTQTSYPSVQFSRIYTNYNGDAQVCYNGSGCVYGSPASGTSQMVVAAK